MSIRPIDRFKVRIQHWLIRHKARIDHTIQIESEYLEHAGALIELVRSTDNYFEAFILDEFGSIQRWLLPDHVDVLLKRGENFYERMAKVQRFIDGDDVPRGPVDFIPFEPFCFEEGNKADDIIVPIEETNTYKTMVKAITLFTQHWCAGKSELSVLGNMIDVSVASYHMLESNISEGMLERARHKSGPAVEVDDQIEYDGSPGKIVDESDCLSPLCYCGQCEYNPCAYCWMSSLVTSPDGSVCIGDMQLPLPQGDCNSRAFADFVSQVVPQVFERVLGSGGNHKGWMRRTIGAHEESRDCKNCSDTKERRDLSSQKESMKVIYPCVGGCGLNACGLSYSDKNNVYGTYQMGTMYCICEDVIKLSKAVHELCSGTLAWDKSAHLVRDIRLPKPGGSHEMVSLAGLCLRLASAPYNLRRSIFMGHSNLTCPIRLADFYSDRQGSK
jgi:hypothetical protein